MSKQSRMERKKISEFHGLFKAIGENLI
jgi:hypothetical protein